MKSTPFVLLLALITTSSLVFGQDFAFKVLANKGNNEVKSGDSWEPLKIGEALQPTQELKLVANGYVGLIHSTGKPMELTEAKTYSIADLSKQVSGDGSGSSVVSKYTDFILSSNSAEAKKNRLSATGAVHRGVEGNAIDVMLPEDNSQQGIYNDKATIQWQSDKVAGPYVVTMKNMFDDVLSSMETPETSVTIDLNDPKLAKENAILVTVSAKADPNQTSKQYVIKRLTDAERAQVDSSLKELMMEVNQSTALGDMILAGFYEQHNLLLDAMTSYEDAIKLAPDVTTYQDDYDDFLVRTGLKKP